MRIIINKCMININRNHKCLFLMKYVGYYLFSNMSRIIIANQLRTAYLGVFTENHTFGPIFSTTMDGKSTSTAHR